VGNDKANKSIMFGAGTCKGVEIKKTVQNKFGRCMIQMKLNLSKLKKISSCKILLGVSLTIMVLRFSLGK